MTERLPDIVPVSPEAGNRSTEDQLLEEYKALGRRYEKIAHELGDLEQGRVMMTAKNLRYDIQRIGREIAEAGETPQHAPKAYGANIVGFVGKGESSVANKKAELVQLQRDLAELQPELTDVELKLRALEDEFTMTIPRRIDSIVAELKALRQPS